MKEKLSHPIFKNESFDVHQDWDIPIPVFFIIAAVRPIRSLIEMTEAERVELINLMSLVRGAMLTTLGIKDVYIFQNEDTEHNFHIWLFPRHTWMEKFGRKIESVRPIMNYARENLFTDENLVEIKRSAELARQELNK